MSSKAGILPWPRGFSELIDGGAGRSTVQDSSPDRRHSGMARLKCNRRELACALALRAESNSVRNPGATPLCTTTSAKRRPITSALAISVWIALAPGAQPRLPGTFRVATFNVFELSCAKIDAVDLRGEHGTHPQLRKAADILRRVQPDVVLINEVDYSADANCARRFVDRYLANRREDLASLDLPHLAYLPVNTGVPSGIDFTAGEG